MSFLRKKEQKQEKQKERYHFFTLRIDGIDLTFVSKEKNQIEMKLTNIKDSYLRGLPFTFQVIQDPFNRNYDEYSFDIKPEDKIIEIIIPNLRDIKLIIKGERLM